MLNKNATAASIVAVLVLSLGAGCEIAQPFDGPGMKDGKLADSIKGDEFVASTTFFQVKDDDASTKAFNDHMTKIQEALKTQPGLIGYSLAFTPGSNDDYRTLAVWESEDAMLEWVTSDVHAAAMQDMADKAKGGSVASFKVKRAEVPPSWDDAKKHLEDDGETAY